MKTFKLIICIILVSSCSIFAQNAPVTPATPPSAAPQKVNPAIKPAAETQQAQPTQLGQPSQPGQPPMVGGQPGMRMNRFMVQIPHSKEQCEMVMKEMKEKGTPMMMRFDWGCAAGEHNGWAMLAGQNEDAVRKQLPEAVQKMAKVTKVEKATAPQMEQMHK